MRSASRVAVVVLATIIPLTVFADDLRSQIRADVEHDPRTAQMSSTEIDALVEALAQQSEAQGATRDYLDSKNQPTYTFPPPSTGALVRGALFSPIIISFGALLLVLAAVATYIIKMRGKPRPAPDLN